METIRLSKLARKYNVGTASIIDYLGSCGFDIFDPNPNTMVPSSVCSLLDKKFGFVTAGKNMNPIDAEGENDVEAAVKNRYLDCINALYSVRSDIASLHGNNSDFANIQSAFVKRLDGLLSSAESEMNHSLHNTVWDNLVVAFFGETNAGKSTIIETFRILFDKQKEQHSDGLIVGDGRSDFTQTYEEYKLNIEDRPFTLIDVPGIEGDEKPFVDGIKNALSKAHLVFYVQGHNKKPDVATAKKIKEYLGDWVNVYSIYNVRGGSFNYRNEQQRETLIQGECGKSEELIKETFHEILGDVYKGNISLQALLALCSVADFSPERVDLRNTQSKLFGQFGSKESLFSFSNFTAISNLIKEKSNNFKEEIVEANKKKLVSLERSVILSIKDEMKQQSETTDKFSTVLNQYKKDCFIVLDETRISIKRKLLAKNVMLFSKLKQNLFDVIDESSSDTEVEEESEKCLNSFSNEYPIVIKKIVNEQFSRMNDKLKEKQRSLNCFKEMANNKDFDSILPDVNLDFSSALSEMSVTFGDFLSTIGSAISAVIVGLICGGGILSIPFAIIGAGLDLVRKCFLGDGGKGKAKAELEKEIRKIMKSSGEKLQGVCQDLNEALNAFQGDISGKIDDDLSGLSTIRSQLSDIEDVIRNKIKEINNKEYGEI